MNKKEQELFVAFFEEIHQTEELLNFLKCELVKCSAYNPNLLFDLLSQKSEAITIQQMRNYLTDRVAFNERQLYEIFQRFDWGRQGFISREDFLNEILPIGTDRNQINLHGGTISAVIEGHFLSLFMEILKRFRIIQVARKQIAFIPPYDAFAQIDTQKSGVIGIGDLYNFFKRNDFEIGDKQLYLLLHGLRRRNYVDVNLEVFCENLNPLQFGEYTAYGEQMIQQRERDELSRSRREQETMKRSRIQTQKIEHQFQKAERKKQAEIQRQLQVEQRINNELIEHEQQKERIYRKALLEEDRNIRYSALGQNAIIHQQQLRNLHERYEHQYLNTLKARQIQAHQQQQLQESAIKRRIQEQGLKRRIDQDSIKRRIDEDPIKRKIEEDQIRRRIEIENSRKTVNHDLQLKLRQQIQKDIAARRNAGNVNEIERSRKRIQEEAIKQRQKYYRQLQLQKLRTKQEIYKSRNVRQPDSNEKYLEQTQDRRSRLADTYSRYNR